MARRVRVAGYVREDGTRVASYLREPAPPKRKAKAKRAPKPARRKRSAPPPKPKRKRPAPPTKRKRPAPPKLKRKQPAPPKPKRKQPVAPPPKSKRKRPVPKPTRRERPRAPAIMPGLGLLERERAREAEVDAQAAREVAAAEEEARAAAEAEGFVPAGLWEMMQRQAEEHRSILARERERARVAELDAQEMRAELAAIRAKATRYVELIREEHGVPNERGRAEHPRRPYYRPTADEIVLVMLKTGLGKFEVLSMFFYH